MDYFQLAALGLALFLGYEMFLRVRAARAATAPGFVLTPLAVTLGSAALSAILRGTGFAASSGIGALGSAIGAIPGILDAIGKSPLWAFLFGAVLAGPAAAVWGYGVAAGHVHDAQAAKLKAETELRSALATLASAKATAVENANRRADEAIAKAKAEYEAKAKPAKPKK